MKGPTARTLQSLRDAGYRAQVVERWCHHSKRRVDLYGFIDVIAVRPSETLGVQATSTTNIQHRVKKILTECPESARDWLEAGNFLTVVGWRKYAKAVDGRLWRPTWRPVTLEDLEVAECQ